MNLLSPFREFKPIDSVCSWRSPSNIALVKYWGKKGHQLPANPSLSMTLKECYTETSVKFSPEIRIKGKYAVYVYIPQTLEIASQVAFNVFDGKKSHPVILKTAEIKKLGLTSGEWVPAGTYDLSPGRQAFLEIGANLGWCKSGMLKMFLPINTPSFGCFFV